MEGGRPLESIAKEGVSEERLLWLDVRDAVMSPGCVCCGGEVMVEGGRERQDVNSGCLRESGRNGWWGKGRQ